MTQSLWDLLTELGPNLFHSAWLTKRCVKRLVRADRYKLDMWKAECIEVLAEANERLAEREWYQKVQKQWGDAMTREVRAASEKAKSAAVEDGDGGETHG